MTPHSLLEVTAFVPILIIFIIFIAIAIPEGTFNQFCFPPVR
jgi:hypothetical protein